jgi:hypothetical protein
MRALISKFILTASAVAALGCTLAPAAAQAGEVQNRIENQQQRIDHGVRDGQMTRREYDHTEARLDRIEAQRNFDLRRNDGHLTFRERRQLNRELNGNSRAIYFDNHNLARQPGAPLR